VVIADIWYFHIFFKENPPFDEPYSTEKKHGTTYNFEVVADVSFGLAFIKEQWLWRSLLRHSCLV